MGAQLALLDAQAPASRPSEGAPWDLFSEPDRLYRYRLGVRWSPGPLINFLMLNPSQASKDKDDPTWIRCQERGKRLAGMDLPARELAVIRARGIPGGIILTNLFALVSTDPGVLKGHPDPIGPDNDRHILEVAQEAALVICAWGGAALAGHHEGGPAHASPLPAL
jgi:hypothetical protein